MRNEKISEPEFDLEFPQKIYDLRTDADIQSRDGFVGDDEFRPECQGTRNSDALALTSGEFVGIARHRGIIHANGSQKFCHALAANFAAETVVDDERFGDDVLHAEARIERAERILKDDLHASAQSPEFSAASRHQIVTFEAETAGCRFDQAQDEAAQRALARSGFANQTERFARLNVERDIVNSADLPQAPTAKSRVGKLENPGEVADFD
jgi:hypothetical protein